MPFTLKKQVEIFCKNMYTQHVTTPEEKLTYLHKMTVDKVYLINNALQYE